MKLARDIGAVLQDLREEYGYTIPALAVRADVHHETIRRIERGDNLPSLAVLLDLCVELDTTIEEVLSESGAK